MRVRTKKEFIETFPLKSTFYWIDWYRGEPIGVRASVFVAIIQGRTGPQIDHTYDDHGMSMKGDHALGDLVGALRGVFTSREEAVEALRQRREAFKRDPKLRERLIEEARRNAIAISRQA